MKDNLSTNIVKNATDLNHREGLTYVLAMTMMCGLDSVAFCANIIILVVVMKNTQLRQTLTNMFLVNLFMVDCLSSILVLPVSIVTYMERQWIMGETFCMVNGFLSCLFTFVSTTTLCVISIERYYSIKSPMHHAANMTMCKTGLVILFLWLCSALFASLPLFGWNSYEYSPSKAHCSFTWETDKYNRLFIIIVVILYFVIPGVVLITMYCGIYLIAKHTSLQVNPISQIQRCVPIDVIGSVNSSSNIVSRNNITHSFSPPSIPTNYSHAKKTPLKAIKTLMIILSMYMVLWGPYFICNLYNATADIPLPISAVNLAFEWMGYASFALNPFLYGVMNRTIREELLRFFKTIICCKHSTKVQDAVDGPNSNEDFYQFLERTSVFPSNKSQTGIDKPEQEELRTVNEISGEKF